MALSQHDECRWRPKDGRACHHVLRTRSFGLKNVSAASVCLSLSLLPVSLEQKSRKGSVLTRGRFQFCCQFTARESVGVELLEKRPRRTTSIMHTRSFALHVSFAPSGDHCQKAVITVPVLEPSSIHQPLP